MKKFEEFKLDEKTMEFIHKNHFTNPTDIQELVIPQAMAGRDVIGLSATGSGKTHAYLIPVFAKVRSGENRIQTVITAPTRELAGQIYDMAKVMNEVDDRLRIHLCIGGNDREREIEQLRARQPHIVIGTPGRIRDLFLNAGALRLDTADILVVDEADMTLEYGFLDDIDAFAGRMKENLQMMAFSATMPDQLKPFIRRYMHHPITCRIEEKIQLNANIRHILVPCYHHSYAEVIKEMLPQFHPYVCLIFANSRKEASQLAEELRQNNVNVTELHGDLTARERKQAMKDIAEAKATYVVATDLAARGIDIGEVTHVISCGFPKDIQYYIHRAGRTARAGSTGVCFALYKESDDAAIRTLMNYGIHFEHKRCRQNGWQDLRPYGQKYRRKEDDELDRKISMVYNNKKNTRVKPGYKKKRKEAIDRIYRRKKRDMIRSKIQEEKKAMYREAARKEREK